MAAFWDWFGKSAKATGQGNVVSVGRNGEPPSAVDYVDWLLKHMLRNSSTELTIDTRLRLPGSDEIVPEFAPPCLPDPDKVINRLKILSGLQPVHLAAPVSAKFEQLRTHHAIIVQTRFEDQDDGSRCRLNLRLRAL